MAEMFGTPVGTRAFEADTREAHKFVLGAQKTLGEIAMQPLEARYKQLQGDELQSKLQEQKDVRELMQRAMQPQAGQEEPADISTRLENAANLFLDTGRVTQGSELAKAASTIREKASQNQSRGVLTQLNQIRQVREQAELVGQIFGDVKDQQELDTANRIFEFQTGRPSPLRGKVYDPAEIAQIRQSSLSVLERADLGEKQLVRKDTADNRTRLATQFDAEQKIRKARLDIERERLEQLKKRGSRLPTAEPKKEEVQHIMNLLRKDHPFVDRLTGADAAQVREATYTIAAEARALMRANPALSLPTALSQAYTNALRGGDIQIKPGTNIIRRNFGGEFKFSGGGRSPETALPIPSDAKSVQKGKYYVNPDGRIGRWNGSKFDIITVSPEMSNRIPLSPDNRNLNEEPD
jgi:hypothetical protein